MPVENKEHGAYRVRSTAFCVIRNENGVFENKVVPFVPVSLRVIIISLYGNIMYRGVIQINLTKRCRILFPF